MNNTMIRTGERKLSWIDLFFPLIFIFFTVVLNMLDALYLEMSVLPTYFLLDMAIFFALALTIFLIPRQTAKLIVTGLLLFLITLVHCVNACVYMVFGDVFSFQMLFLIKETFSVLDISYFHIPAILSYCSIFVFFLAISTMFIKYVKKNKELLLPLQYKKLLSVFLAAMIIITPLFHISKQQITSTPDASATSFDITNDGSLYSNLIFKYSCLEKFGFFGFYTKEVINTIFGTNLQMNTAEQLEIHQQLIDGHNKTGSTVNKGSLAGDNLICILTESLEWFAIDPVYTPTLYSMYNEESVCLTNYYSKNKTNVSEGIINFAGMPSNCIMPSSANGHPISNPYSLASMLTNRGYTSNYFHSFLDSFYSRNSIMPAMGFDQLYFANKTEMDYVTSSFSTICSDLMFFEAVKDYMVPDSSEGKFFSAYATMSSHCTYDYKKDSLLDYHMLFEDSSRYTEFNEYMMEEYQTDLNSMPENELDLFLNYKVGVIDLDRTVEAILDELEEKGLKENTTIVLYSDHNCYGNNVGSIMKKTDRLNAYINEAYRVPACIYSSKLEPQKIDAFTNPYDLNKTISLLFDLDYNEAISNGYNIFDEEDLLNSFFVSFTSGIFADARYAKGYDKIYNQLGEVISDEEEIATFIEKINKFYAKQILVDKIYKYNILFDFEIQIDSADISTLIKKSN